MAVLLSLLICTSNALGRDKVIRINIPQEMTQDKQTFSNNKNHYFKSLLLLALEKTRPANDSDRLININKSMSQTRAFEELQHNNVDVIWSMTSIDREKLTHPVRTPLLKGLLDIAFLLFARANSILLTKLSALKIYKHSPPGRVLTGPTILLLKITA